MKDENQNNNHDAIKTKSHQIWLYNNTIQFDIQLNVYVINSTDIPYEQN